MTLSRRDLFRLAAGAGAGALPALPFEDGPPVVRKSGMIVHAVRPEDLEMPLAFLTDYITPAEHFFVRTHTYAAQVSLSEWRLDVAGEVLTALTLTMADLKQLPAVELVSVLECAGNGRAFYDPAVTGLQWGQGAVGNARWTGVRLADALKKAGLKESARHILFDGADTPPGTMPDFQRTITVKKALDANTLLAYQMNGQPIPMQHGFPLRLIVPGWAGDSWVKWVTRITVLDREFDGFFMKTAYRHPGKPVRPGQAVPPEKMAPVTSLRVKSLIGSPADGSTLAPEQPTRISGAAWAGDGAPVDAVDISTDGGRTWRPAALSGPRSQFGWRLWSVDWRPAQEQYYTILSRARTANGDIQPLTQEWNPSGYQWNVVASVGVNVTPAKQEQSVSISTDQPQQPAGYRSACLVCHENDVVTQQRLTRPQWDREMDKMVKWGAKVKPEDREGILAYLANHFGPRPR